MQVISIDSIDLALLFETMSHRCCRFNFGLPFRSGFSIFVYAFDAILNMVWHIPLSPWCWWMCQYDLLLNHCLVSSPFRFFLRHYSFEAASDTQDVSVSVENREQGRCVSMPCDFEWRISCKWEFRDAIWGNVNETIISACEFSHGTLFNGYCESTISGQRQKHTNLHIVMKKKIQSLVACV